MTTWLLKKLNSSQIKAYPLQPELVFSKNLWRFFLFIFSLIAIQYYSPELFEVISATMSDAYIGVSVFVAATLAVFYYLDRSFKSDLTKYLNEQTLMQVPVASFLGALPGCGGAIIVVTQFVNGTMSFGALVAVLISTMGDAAFLLLAQKPDIALLIYSVSAFAGITFGYIINFIHGHDYLKSEHHQAIKEEYDIPRVPKRLIAAFIMIAIPGCVIGLLEAFQVDTNAWFGQWAYLDPVKWLGFMGALICIAVWISQPLDSWSARFAEKADIPYLKETVVAETSFVSVWVILGFLAYELLVYFTGLDLQSLFFQLGGLAIFFAIIIGFVPGCGPQIVITTLYINGVVPLSAQLANAISNDGDALFPAIALAPKAAIQATVYSAIPAFIIGYTAFSMGW